MRSSSTVLASIFIQNNIPFRICCNLYSVGLLYKLTTYIFAQTRFLHTRLKITFLKTVYIFRLQLSSTNNVAVNYAVQKQFNRSTVCAFSGGYKTVFEFRVFVQRRGNAFLISPNSPISKMRKRLDQAEFELESPISISETIMVHYPHI